uniref:L-serine ammonia-lyase, iron-sulfur-dependent subunit beta n=1 Tax=Ndongobacter massiliensis TaxID=1871025 RepID=UPI00093137BA|nr:L-serine ammonia-lyase, iron-sulfur-dependent subunit beta [Ndongobacter massiliensis]
MDSSIIFRDVIGPIMVGPSSSHTAGACRLGNIARAVYGKPPRKVRLLLHGSFAETYRGHGTDRALLGGLLGMCTDDPGIIDGLGAARRAGLEFEFLPANLGGVHPNTVRFEFLEDEAVVCAVTGSSIGGGQVRIIEIDGKKTEFDGKLASVIITYPDRKNMILDITTHFSKYHANIATMRVSREKQSVTLFAELDDELPTSIVDEILNIDGVTSCRLIPRLV